MLSPVLVRALLGDREVWEVSPGSDRLSSLISLSSRLCAGNHVSADLPARGDGPGLDRPGVPEFGEDLDEDRRRLVLAYRRCNSLRLIPGCCRIAARI